MGAPELYLLYSGPGAVEHAYRIWPEREALPAGAIQEARSYVLELRDAIFPAGCQLYVDGQRLRRDLPGDGTVVQWTWEIGFYAGQVEMRLELPNGVAHDFLLEADPDLAKLTRAEFDQMVRESLEDTFALLSLSSYKWQVARGTGHHMPQIAQLEFLYSRLNDLEAVVHQIQARPVRVLASQPADLPLHRVKMLSPTDLQRSLASRHVVKTDNQYLPKALNGYFPERIHTAVKSAGLDITEHRAIRTALMHWAGLLTGVAEQLERPSLAGNPDRQGTDQKRLWSRRCRRMTRRLFQLLELPLFQEVSAIPTPVVSTPIFQRSPAYSRFLALHRDFQLGFAKLPGDFLGIPLARTFDLYELWVFLRLARVAPLLNPSDPFDPAPVIESISRGALVPSLGTVALPIGPGMRLLFQREYREYWVEADNVGSFTRPMRPDVTLEMVVNNGTVRLLAIDAKYRIDVNLNDAISSAHVYRDSLVAPRPGSGELERVVSGAYLLTPHQVREIPDLWTQAPMPDRLFHAGYRKAFRVGAFTMRPGMPLDVVQCLLAALVAELKGAATDA